MDAQVLIIGGGLNGSALALALAGAGLSVTIVEPQNDDTLRDNGFDGRGYALAHSSKRLLAAIGIWGAVDADAQPMLEIKVTDARTGAPPSPFVLEFDHAEIEEGPMGWMVEDRHLRRAFLDAMSGNNRITRVQSNVDDHKVSDNGVTATLSDGSVLRACVMVGADGVHSNTAARAKLAKTGWDYDQTALVCAIAHEKPHNGVAHQLFLPPGPLAILPLTNNRASLVWTETTQEAARIQSLNDADYLATLRPRVGDFLGDFTLAGTRFTYPLMLRIAHHFVAPRVALLGDAAHRVHPIAGQGLNAGLKDVGALTEVLALAARRGEDIGAINVLERYQQWRRFDTVTLALATDSVNRLFSNDNSALRLARDLGMGAINALPGLRRSFIREAAGLTGTLPKLLQGQQI